MAHPEVETPAPRPNANTRGSLRAGRVAGIPIHLHWTFLLVLPVFAYLMAHSYFSDFGAREVGAAEYAWGAALAGALFLSVFLHELGHSLTALRLGVKVRSITLLPIGGLSAFDRVPRSGGDELKITAAGPAVNFVIAAPLLGAWFAGLIPRAWGLPAEFLFWVGALNLLIGGFNLLIPAFPMDGGRILRASLTPRLGLRRATEVAAGVGRGLALLMGLWGLFNLAGGGWLLLLIAFFIFTGATAEEQGIRILDTLGKLQVRDLMTREVHTLKSTDTVEQAFHEMLRTKHLVFPVEDEAGTLRSILHLSDLAAVPTDAHSYTLVGDVARPGILEATPETPASTALETLNTREGEPLLVMRGHDLVGILTRTDLLRAVQILDAEHAGPRGRPRAAG